jgi:hypothetical protein
MKEPATQAKMPEVTPQRSAFASAAKLSNRASVHPILRLQRAIGNRAVQRYVQAKLIVGAANDEYEQEAERVAEQVMRMPASPFPDPDEVSIHRRASEVEGGTQLKPLAASITRVVQRARSDPLRSFEPGADFESRLSGSGGGNPLPASTRAFMESRFGADFSGVRLHTGSEAAQLNRAVNAQAFAHGLDIYLGEGKHDLKSSAGKQLLAHELTHVIQQTGSPPLKTKKMEEAPSANIVLARQSEARVLARSNVHTDKQLFDMMQKFRSKNDQLSESQQNKIFWAIKKATDSDEVAYTFFDYYSGYLGAGHQILPMTPAEEANAKKSGTFAKTPSGGDTKLRSDVFTMPDETLGPLLLHEFAHTGHHTNWGGTYDFEEGQAYGVEYYYAERTGNTTRMASIITIISAAAARWGAGQAAAVQENFKVTYALMHALGDLTKSGSSTLPPLAGKGSADGRVMAAEFVSDFRGMSKDLTALWDHIRTHLTSFVVPVI